MGCCDHPPEPGPKRPPDVPGVCLSLSHCVACRQGDYGQFDCPHGVITVTEAERLQARELPQLAKRASTFWQAIQRQFEARTFAPADPDQVEARLAQCATCPWHEAEAGKLPYCVDCGCYVTLKARFTEETCPRGKW